MDKTEVLQAECSFETLTFQHLTLSLDYYERKEYLSSAIMAAVFAEALLEDISVFYKIKFGSKDPSFQSMISEIKSKIQTSEDASEEDKTHITDLANRCDEIRQKRNRLVHNNGVEHEKIDTNVAANDMNHNVMKIVDTYLKTKMASEIRKRMEASRQNKEPLRPDRSFKVFISTITPHTVEQEVFLNAVSAHLSHMGIDPVKCSFDDYDKGDPMGKVRKTIESCDAVLVIGLERSHTFYYRDKESSSSEKEGIHRKHTSGWLHVESGIAMALGKPIFVLCQKDIYGDGIFDRDWNSYIVVEFPTPLDAMHNKVQMTLRKIREYAESCNKKIPEKEEGSPNEA